MGATQKRLRFLRERSRFPLSAMQAGQALADARAIVVRGTLPGQACAVA